MAKVDWSETLPTAEPGFYLAEVRKCDEKTSSGGDPYFNVELHDSDVNAENGLLCWDNIMLAGKGRGLGQAKLKALGFSDKNADIDPPALVGRRAWIKLYHEIRENKTRIRVDSHFTPEFSCGYWPEASPPEGAKDAPVDDIPF